MTQDSRRAILALKQIAAVAEKLADDLEHNRLWPGEASAALAQIQGAMQATGGLQ